MLNPGKSQKFLQNSGTGTNRSNKNNIILVGSNSNRRGEHQSSCTTAEFIIDEGNEREEIKKRGEVRYNKLAEIVSKNNSANPISENKVTEDLDNNKIQL